MFENWSAALSPKQRRRFVVGKMEEDDDGACESQSPECSPMSQTQQLLSQTQQAPPMPADDDGDDERYEHWGSLVPLPPTRYARFDFAHGQDAYVVGRSANDSDVHIGESWVGRRHLRIRRLEHAPGSLPVAELEHLAQNDTWVNGARMRTGERRLLQAGDVLSLVLNNLDGAPQVRANLFAVFEWQTFRRPLHETASQDAAAFSQEEAALDGGGDVRMLAANYDVYNQIGSGAFARVMRAVDRRDGGSYAVKIIDMVRLAVHPGAKPPPAGGGGDGDAAARRARENYEARAAHFGKQMDIVKREVSLLSAHRHPSLVRLHESWYDPADCSWYIAMELAGGPELYYRVADHGALEEADARYASRRLLAGIAFLHGRGVVHRDLKPENILMGAPLGAVREFDVKIADFGIAKCIPDEGLQTYCGSPQYLAPEVCVGKHVTGGGGGGRGAGQQRTGYNSKVDMWSLGATLYVALSASMAYDCNANGGAGASGLPRSFSPSFEGPPWDEVSAEARRFLAALMQVDPARRPTAQDAQLDAWFEPSAAPANPAGPAMLQRQPSTTPGGFKWNVPAEAKEHAATVAASAMMLPPPVPAVAAAAAAAVAAAAAGGGAGAAAADAPPLAAAATTVPPSVPAATPASAAAADAGAVAAASASASASGSASGESAPSLLQASPDPWQTAVSSSASAECAAAAGGAGSSARSSSSSSSSNGATTGAKSPALARAESTMWEDVTSPEAAAIAEQGVAAAAAAPARGGQGGARGATAAAAAAAAAGLEASAGGGGGGGGDFGAQLQAKALSELRAECRTFGLSAKGGKALLVQRLTAQREALLAQECAAASSGAGAAAAAGEGGSVVLAKVDAGVHSEGRGGERVLQPPEQVPRRAVKRKQQAQQQQQQDEEGGGAPRAAGAAEPEPLVRRRSTRRKTKRSATAGF